MNSRSMRATGLVAVALSSILLLYAWRVGAQSRRTLDAAEVAIVKMEERRDQMRAMLDAQHREIVEFKYLLDRLIEEEKDRARRAGRQPWRERID